MKQFILYSTLVLMLPQLGNAQKVLNLASFINAVRNHHPLSKQSDLQADFAKYNKMAAKGELDPTIYSDIEQKYYTDDQYYSLIDAGLAIPTRVGASVEVGYELNEGQYLNPENRNPSNGLTYIGLSVPLGQGLLMDKRRAELRKAEIYLQQTEAARKNMLNDLFLDASNTYWSWFESYYDLLIYEEALEIAEQRFEAVFQDAQNGERPYIDTVEAGIQVQNRKLALQQNQLQFKNNSALLEIYLWADGLLPLRLSEETVPEDFFTTEVAADTSLMQQISTEINVSEHPLLSQYQLGINGYKVDQRLKKEMLKPELNLKYQALADPTNNSGINYDLSNYRWGMEFKMPIFLRSERGELRLAELKIQEAEYELKSKQLMVANKTRTFINEYRTTSDQIFLWNNTVSDYLKLLEGERVMFNQGESSLFMVNSREVAYINARIKLVGLVTKNRVSKIKALYTYGILHEAL